MKCLLIWSQVRGRKASGLAQDYRRHQVDYSTCKLKARGKLRIREHPDAQMTSDVRIVG